MQICLNGISVYTIIGCYPDERKHKQELIINLKIEIDNYEQIASSDDLNTTIDYDEAINYIKTTVENINYQLLEKLALHINNSILDYYPIANSVSIELIKPAICGKLADEIKVVHTSIREYNIALALGSNADNLPQQQIITAIEILATYIKNIKLSKFYKTKPYGYQPQNNFYNAVITGATTLKPDMLLAKIKKIEKMLGKNEICLGGPRSIDLDIIFFDNLVYQHNFLIIPHPQMHLRDFVLKPLSEVAGSWMHPVLHKDVNTLCNELKAADKTIINVEDYAKGVN